MKSTVKSLIPPIIVNALKNIRRPEPVFSNYEEALAACKHDAYQSQEIVKIVVEKNLIHKRGLIEDKIVDFNAMRTLTALGIINTGRQLRVLDFGGGGGYHHAIAKIGMPSVSVKWNVVETPAMAKEAQRLSKDDLHFFDSIDSARLDNGDIDLVFSSSALQYCPAPLKILQQLVDIGAKHLFITRTAFNHEPETIIAIQNSQLADNGPGPLPSGFKNSSCSYPISFLPKADAEEIIKSKYDIRFAIVEARDVHTINNKKMHLYGYFCDLRN